MSDDVGESERGLDEVSGVREERVRGRKKTGRPVGSKNRTVTQILTDGNPDVSYTMVPGFSRPRGAMLRGLLQ